MKLIRSFVVLALMVAGLSAAVPLGPVPYSRLPTNDFRVDAQGFVWLRLSPSITVSNNVILVTTNLYVTNATIFINGTNVAVINPTDNYLAKRGGPTNLVDSIISDDGTTAFFHGTGKSSLTLKSDDGELIFGAAGTNRLYRDGLQIVLTNSTIHSSSFVNDGQIIAYGIAGVSPAYSFTDSPTSGYYHSSVIQHWSESGQEEMRLTYNALPFANAGTLSLGTGALTFGSGVGASDCYFYRNGSAGALAISNGTNTSSLSIYGLKDNLGNSSGLFISHGGTNDGIHLDSQSAGTAGAPRNMYFDFGGTNQFRMVPGSAESFLQVVGSSGELASFGQVGGSPQVLSASGKVIWLRPDAGANGDIIVNSSAIAPDVDNQFSVGTASSNGAMKDSYFKGHQHAVGMNDGAGNYTWLDLYHGGTNDAIHFDSQSAGTAGSPRPFYFGFNNANKAFLGPLGSLMLGGTVLTNYGDSSQYSIRSSHVVSAGDDQDNSWYLETTSDSSFTDDASVIFNAHAAPGGPCAAGLLMDQWVGSDNESMFEINLNTAAGTFTDSSFMRTRHKGSSGSATNTFLINIANSGYTGTGTKPFMDNGTFGGGITTNISGGGLTLTIVNGLITAVTAP